MNTASLFPLPSVLFVTSLDAYDRQIADFLKTRVSLLRITQSGEEGIALFKSEKPDIVIINRHLGDMNGLDFAARILQLASELPIVVVTGDSDIQTLLRAIDIGVSKYLIKPI